MLNILTVYVLLLLLGTLFFFQYHGDSTYALVRLKNHNSNETVLNSPTDSELIEALSNGKTISDYMTPNHDDLVLNDGNWTIGRLIENFPLSIQRVSFENKETGILIKKTIFVDKGAQLRITDERMLLESFPNKDNVPTKILTSGKLVIFNSTVTSWNPLIKAPDFNPYHPRPFLVAKDGGKMDILNSTIVNMGFSLGGIHTLFSSLAGLNYYNTSNFIIANSTIAHNLYGFYSDESSNFKIIGNNIFDHEGYGLDPHTGSKNFLIDSNYVRFNDKQGIICSFRCQNVTITHNVVEYNTEGIGLHWLTNSSIIKNNIVKYNKNYGIFIKTNSTNDYVENNTVLGNGYGIGLFEGSNGNTIKSNIVVGNILDPEGIKMDESSTVNNINHNRIFPTVATTRSSND